MPLETFSQLMLPAIEAELQRAISIDEHEELNELHEMMAYHLGWQGEDAGPEARGKRLRPLLVLLTCASAGGKWQSGMPAAVAVELVHNFSLIHDDIEDHSPLRRGRPTVWKKWGIPQAINTGDAMFTQAHLSLLHLQETCKPEITIQAVELLQRTCLKLTQGQYLDISYESRSDLSLEAYWMMVSGKTAALLSACTELGALIAECSPNRRGAYREFGHSLGMAYQALDDILGVWGDEELTGKSVESDLVTGKKSLPILFGLYQKGSFYNRWIQGKIHTEEAPAIAQLLEVEGARCYSIETADLLTRQALQALERARPEEEAGQALKSLASSLLQLQN